MFLYSTEYYVPPASDQNLKFKNCCSWITKSMNSKNPSFFHHINLKKNIFNSIVILKEYFVS
jgi:hypothetical protein